MPTIAAGTSPTISLAAGQRLAFSAGGAGVATISRGSTPDANIPLGQGPVSIGSYDSPRNVSIYCERPLTYQAISVPLTHIGYDPAQAQIVDPLGSPVSGAGKPLSLLWMGDSFGQRSNVGTGASAATVSNGVMTVTANGHGLGTGMLASLAGAAVPACMFQVQPVTRVDANTVTVAVPGAPDGAVAVSAAARSGLTLVRHGQHSEEGTFVWLQRRSGYAFEMVRNVSQPGYTVAEVVALADQLVTPLIKAGQVDRIVAEMGYNSLAQSESADTSYLAISNLISKYPSTPIDFVCFWPIVSGSGADSPTKLQTQLDVQRRCKALCDASRNARWVDVFSGTVNASTGYVQTGYGGPDNIHKPARASDYAASGILSGIPAASRVPRTLVASGLDSVATNATNPNIARNGLGLTTTGGSASTYTTTPLADEVVALGAAITFTGALTAATSGTLTPVWAGATGSYTLSFSDGSVRTATLTNGSGSVSWTGAVTATANGYAVLATRLAGGAMSAYAAATTGGTTGNIFFKAAAAGNAQCLRAIGSAAGDQARLSLTLTTSDIVLGGKLDLTMRLKLRTDFNASNKTPAGQNVRGLLVQLVLVIDGNTYTVILSNVQGTPSAGIYVLSDIDTAMSASGIVVPTGAACTTARIDAIAHFDGAGTAQIELSEIALRKAD